MNQKKIIGPEYKDEYKRKHRSKLHEKNEEDQQKNSEHWIRRGTALLTLL